MSYLGGLLFLSCCVADQALGHIPFQSHCSVHIRERARDQPLPVEIEASLQINRDNSKSKAAIIRVIETRFSSSFNVVPFVDRR